MLALICCTRWSFSSSVIRLRFEIHRLCWFCESVRTNTFQWKESSSAHFANPQIMKTAKSSNISNMRSIKQSKICAVYADLGNCSLCLPRPRLASAASFCCFTRISSGWLCIVTLVKYVKCRFTAVLAESLAYLGMACPHDTHDTLGMAWHWASQTCSMRLLSTAWLGPSADRSGLRGVREIIAMTCPTCPTCPLPLPFISFISFIRQWWKWWYRCDI